MNNAHNIPNINAYNPKGKGGLVVYPQKYYTTGDYVSDYVYGLDHFGLPCICFIHPSEVALNNEKINSDKSYPKISEFARKGRKAKNPCREDEQNSERNPAGILMFEQVELSNELSAQYNTNAYIAKWASVINDGEEESPVSHVGVGYMEISFRKPDSYVNELLLQYKELQDQISASTGSVLELKEQLINIYTEINDKTGKSFTAVMMRTKLIRSFQGQYDKESIGNFLFKVLEKYTTQGLYGGALVRVRSGDFYVPELCHHVSAKYDYANGEVIDFNTVLMEYFKYNEGKLRKAFSLGYTVDLIPVIRINCGSKGNALFAKQFSSGSDTPKVLKTYVDKKIHDTPLPDIYKLKGYMFANVATRIGVSINGKDAGNRLLSTLHAFSAPKGNVFSVDHSGESFYKPLLQK